MNKIGFVFCKVCWFGYYWFFFLKKMFIECVFVFIGILVLIVFVYDVDGIFLNNEILYFIFFGGLD